MSTVIDTLEVTDSPVAAPLAETHVPTLTYADVRAALLARKTPDTTICDNLNISPSTLKTHIRNIHRRLGISSRHELAWLVTANPAGISETQGGGR